MSVLLRDCVKRFLREVEDQISIDERSTLGELRRLVRIDERRDAAEPSIRHDGDLHLAQLVEALRLFQKPGGHFAGCHADRFGGPCTAVCRQAQTALMGDRTPVADGTVAALMATITALERERRSLVSLRRRPGRPRKKPPLQHRATSRR